jgi:hypothetical protein
MRDLLVFISIFALALVALAATSAEEVPVAPVTPVPSPASDLRGVRTFFDGRDAPREATLSAGALPRTAQCHGQQCRARPVRRFVRWLAFWRR